MKIKIIVMLPLSIVFSFLSYTTNADEDIFTDYCQPGLCPYTGGDGAHSGCKNGVRHNGKFQHPPCSDDAAVIPLSDEDKQAILEFHNVQRNFVACGGLYEEYQLGPGCRHGIVTWDKELEKTSFLHASYCIFAHDKCRGTLKYPFGGQNLGVLTFRKKPYSNFYYINAITYLWYVEYLYTKMDMINEYYDQDKWMVGHFLTLINERNTRIGCSFVRYFDGEAQKNTVMLSCNYPTTNIDDSTIYNSCKKPASMCTTGTDSKYKYLCTSREEYDVSGFLDLIPYDGDGTEKFDCGRRVEFFHYDREGSADIKMLHKITYPDIPVPVEQPQQSTIPQPVQQPVQHPVQPPVQHPVQPPVHHPVQPPVQHPVQQPVQHPVQPPVQRPVQQPVQHPAQQPIQQPVQHPAQQPIQQPAQKPVQQPAQKPVQKPAQKPVQKPAQKPVQQPAQKPVQKPVQQPIRRPVQQPVKKPVQRPIQQPVRPPIHKPIRPPIHQPVRPPIHHPEIPHPSDPFFAGVAQDEDYCTDGNERSNSFVVICLNTCCMLIILSFYNLKIKTFTYYN